MSSKIIQERLLGYNCTTDIEEHQAIREITQEVVLAALGRSDFFNYALFQGGTCLRVFYGLNRFSEDLDFILRKPNDSFVLSRYLVDIRNELTAYGYNIEVIDRSSRDAIVKKAFLKDNSLGSILDLQYSGNKERKIRIKFEVDSNPPAGSDSELKYLDFPFLSSVVSQDIPSLFAGKLHALLCRKYVKGRDWYDFLWYISRKSDVNYQFLSSAIYQSGFWSGENITIDRRWLLNELREKINQLDWHHAVEDVRRFIRVNELPSLDLWSKELFLGQLEKLQ